MLQLWRHARCVLTGVGPPPLLRSEAPQFIDMTSSELIEAVGDVCSRFFNRAGEPVLFPGSERLMAVDLETLKRIPTVIAVAAGANKVAPIIAAARAKLFTAGHWPPHCRGHPRAGLSLPLVRAAGRPSGTDNSELPHGAEAMHLLSGRRIELAP